MTVRRRRDGGWMLDAGIIGGRRLRRTFPTREAALNAAVVLRAELRHEGERVAASRPEDRARWLALEDACAEAGGTLDEAVRFWLASRPGSSVVPVSKVGAQWAEAHRGVRGPRHLYQVGMHWDDFAGWVGDSGWARVTTAGIAEHLAWGGWSAATRRARLASISCVLGWCARQGWLPENPARRVPKPAVGVSAEIAILRPGECAALLRRAARDEEDRDVLAYVVLGMFLGMRSSEVHRAMATEWHPETAEWIVPLGKAVGGRTRGRKRRVIDVEATGVEWLQWMRLESWTGKILRPNFRRRWERVQAVVAPWPENGLRHSYATYHYARHRDEGRLQAMMGHDSPAVLHEHYRGLVRRADADEFWGLGPGAVLSGAA